MKRIAKFFGFYQQPHQTMNLAHSETDEDPLIDCRLRHGLNEDTLETLFTYLTVYELIQLYNLSDYFKDLIVSRVVNKVIINFMEVRASWTTDEVFRVFGKRMTKLKICQRNTALSFSRFLRLVIENCSVNMLTAVELEYSRNGASDELLIQQSVPYFTNIRRLVVIAANRLFDQILTGLSQFYPHLVHLTLNTSQFYGKLLEPDCRRMPNLKELRIHKTTTDLSDDSEHIEALSKFVRTRTNLKLFSYIGSENITPVINSLTKYCKLKTFFFYQLMNDFDRSMTSISLEMATKSNFVRDMRDVTTLGLTSFTTCGSDLFQPLVRIAANNTVESLYILMNYDQVNTLSEENRLQCPDEFRSFTSLKAIEIQILSEHSHHQYSFDARFICEFISKLNCIERCTVLCNDACLRDVYRVIEIAPNLKQLSIEYIRMKHLPADMWKIVRACRKRQSLQTTDLKIQPIQLTVTSIQSRELEVYKDRKKFLTTQIMENNYKKKCDLFDYSVLLND